MSTCGANVIFNSRCLYNEGDMRMHNTTFQSVPQEYIIRSIIREQLLNDNKSNLDLLTEGIAVDLAQDAIQFAVGAAAEYGIGGAIAVGTLGAGAGVGPAVETAVDAAFAPKEVAATIEAVSEAAKNAGEFASLLKDAIDGFGGDFGGYYEKQREAVQITIEKMSKDGKAKVEEIVEKLKEVIDNIVSEIVGAIESGIKLVIPDATAGLAAAKAIGAAIKSLSENAYDTLTGAIESVDLLNQAITNPDEVIAYFEEILQAIADKLVEVGEYFNDMSWPKALLAGGPVGGTILKKLGPKGFDELAGMLEKSIPDIVNVIEMVLKKVVPALFACLGIYQILMKDEYKTEDMKEKEKSEDNTGAIEVEKEDKNPLTGEAVSVGKDYLYKVINETIEENRMLIHSRSRIPQRIYEREYVRKVLDIDLPLNESYPYSPAIQERILEEQLQLEGFFSDFKKLGGDTKNSALALRYIMEEPERIASYLDILMTEIKESYEGIKQFLKEVIEELKVIVKKYISPKIEKVLQWSSDLLSKIEKLMSAAASASGWKGVMIASGAVVGIGYLWSKFKGSSKVIVRGLGKVRGLIGSNIEEAYNISSVSLLDLYDHEQQLVVISEDISSQLKAKIDEVIAPLIEKIKTIGPKVVTGLAVNALAGALTGGVGTAFNALRKVFGGSKVVFKFLGAPLEKFVNKIKDLEEETREAEAGLDDPTDNNVKIKESVRNNSILKITRQQLSTILEVAIQEG